MSEILAQLRKELVTVATPEAKKRGEIFFKEDVKILGVKTGLARKIGIDYFKQIEDKGKENIFKLSEELWKSGFLEESLIACNWINSVQKEYKPDDMGLFKNWIDKYVTNWASCDTFCNHPVGNLVTMYPAKIAELKKWAKSKNRWLKRAAAVSLIIPARNGKFQKEIFEIADILLVDPDDMVQKGYGWMLKALSESEEKDQKAVFDYVMRNKDKMPRTSLRYAIEKMPKDLKKEAMAK